MSKSSPNNRACLKDLPRSESPALRARAILGDIAPLSAFLVGATMGTCLMRGQCHVIRRVTPGQEEIQLDEAAQNFLPSPWLGAGPPVERIRAPGGGGFIAFTYWLQLPS